MDVERIKQESRGKWMGIFQALGIEVPENKKHGFCPICRAGKDRFRLFPDSVDGDWYCNQCEPHAGDGIALVQRVTGMSFKETVNKISELIGGVNVEFKPSKPKKCPSIYLNKVWQSSEPLTGIDPVSEYLKSRGITIIPDNVRYCRRCYESETKTEMQAMVARIQNREGKPISLHMTYLKDGKKADIKSPKKMMTGTESLEGSAIRLFSGRDILGVAEGLETALSCMQLFKIPTWAVMSSGLMEKWISIEDCKKVVVFADNDLSFVGIRSAGILANKLFSKGFSVEIKMPEITGQDWNDVLCEKGQES